jgi:hypothetical protein
MLFSDHAGSRRRQRTLARLLGGIVLAVVIPCSLSGCSSPALHKSSPQQPLPTNPWIKPAKPETTSERVKGFFYKEKKPKSPKDWLAQPRPE